MAHFAGKPDGRLPEAELTSCVHHKPNGPKPQPARTPLPATIFLSSTRPSQPPSPNPIDRSIANSRRRERNINPTALLPASIAIRPSNMATAQAAVRTSAPPETNPLCIKRFLPNHREATQARIVPHACRKCLKCLGGFQFHPCACDLPVGIKFATQIVRYPPKARIPTALRLPKIHR